MPLKGHFLGRGNRSRIIGGRLLCAIQLQDGIDPNFPDPALGVVVLFVSVFPAAQLAFNLQVGALGQGLRVVRELSPDDGAMPFGVRDVFARLLVFVRIRGAAPRRAPGLCGGRAGLLSGSGSRGPDLPASLACPSWGRDRLASARRLVAISNQITGWVSMIGRPSLFPYWGR